MRFCSRLLLLAGTLIFLSCSKKESAPAAAAPRTAPIGPGADLNTNQLDVAKVRLDLAAARAAIEAHRMTHDGAYPPDLQSLGVKLHYPADITYHPGTGRVASKTYTNF